VNYRFRTTSITHEGLVRQANEDSFLDREPAGLWAVADGMGGFKNGRWASTALVTGLQSAPIRGELQGDLQAVADAITQANAEIRSESERAGARMGSTVVALLIGGSRFGCIWAGDSRAYLLRDGELIRLSRDHTHAEAMVERGLITPQEARTHPMGHVLSRAVGVEPNLELEAVVDEVRPRDVFLLCSDGLTHLVTDEEIAERLTSVGLERACARLLELVMSRGASDNVTMVGVACEEKTALVFGESV